MASTTTSKEEIRSVIKFCASGQTPADALNQITKVYGDNSVCRTLVFDWHKRFREGRALKITKGRDVPSANTLDKLLKKSEHC